MLRVSLPAPLAWVTMAKVRVQPTFPLLSYMQLDHQSDLNPQGHLLIIF